MLSVNPYQKYKQNSVETASAGEITLMLFEGCVKFLKQAHSAISIKDIANANTNLIKAQNIVLELMASLDFNYEISNSLFPVYSYIYNELVAINVKKDIERLEPIIEIMNDYYETWQEAVKKDRLNKYAFKDGGYV